MFSGEGSTAELARPYESVIVEFLRQHDVQSVLDFGCGDFQVSDRICERMNGRVRFYGYDISTVVIQQNRAYYPDRYTFFTGDVDLPAVDVVTVKQVLQHVRFQVAQEILDRVLTRCRYLVIAEDVASPRGQNAQDFKPWAVDGIDRGIYVDSPPFNLPVEHEWALPWESEDVPGYLRVTVTKGVHGVR